MNRYFGSLLLLFVVIRSTSTQVCQIGSDGGVMGGETKLFCKVTSAETPDRGGTKWVGPHGDLILRGLVVANNIDIEMAIDGFYLIIKNTTKSDLGTYSCRYGTSPLSDCKLGLENFQGTTVAPSEMKDWEIALIVVFAIIFFLVIAAIAVYGFCFKNRTKDTKRCFAGLSSYSWFQCSNQMSTSGHSSHTCSTSSSNSIETEHGTGVKILL